MVVRHKLPSMEIRKTYKDKHLLRVLIHQIFKFIIYENVYLPVLAGVAIIIAAICNFVAGDIK